MVRMKKDCDIVGISFGTTSACVALWRANKVEVIANDQGSRSMPTTVAWTDEEVLVGEAAQMQAVYNIENTITDTSRMLGRSSDDKTLQEDAKNAGWAFKVVKGKGGSASVAVTFKGEPLEVSAEEVASRIFLKMKETAAAYLGSEVKQAVISVPAAFDGAQRAAVTAAAKSAGLEVLSLVTEPAAALVAYGLDKKWKDESKAPVHVAVLDVGGRTTDASVVEIYNGVPRLLAQASNRNLGGADFDKALCDEMVKQFTKQNKPTNALTENKFAMKKLLGVCERAKRTLSSSPQAIVELDALHEGVDWYTQVSRAKFEGLNRSSFRGVTNVLREALEKAGVYKTQVKQLVLVGGSLRIPRLRWLASKFFDDNVWVSDETDVMPEEAFASGCAVQACLLSRTRKAKDEPLSDQVLSASLGVAGADGVVVPLLRKGARLPATNTLAFSTSEDNQAAVFLEVYEGERSRTADNKLVGQFQVKGISAAPRGEAAITVTLSVNTLGELSVTAQESGAKGKPVELTVSKGDNPGKSVDLSEEDAAQDAAERAWSAESIKFGYYLDEVVEEIKGWKGVAEIEKLVAAARKWHTTAAAAASKGADTAALTKAIEDADTKQGELVEAVEDARDQQAEEAEESSEDDLD
jgi:heat shock protein 1/8